MAINSLLESTNIRGGKVLQVVRATMTAYVTTTSTSFVDVPNFSVGITPTSTSSSIILICTFEAFGNHPDNVLAGQITDASNNAVSGAEEAWALDAANANQMETVVMVGYSSPATTSAITYKVRWRRSASVSGSIALNYDGGTPQIFAIEVGA